MISKLEALVDSIGWLNGSHDPDSDAYVLRNPLLVKSFALAGKHEIDDQGRRQFESIVSGYRACLFDIELKVHGKSRAGLDKDATLERLLGVYGISGPGPIEIVVKFLRRALKDKDITKSTPVSYFTGKSE